MKILVLNSGSSSVKYKLISTGKDGDKVLAEGGVEKIGLPDGFLKFKLASGEKEITELGLFASARIWKSIRVLTKPVS